MASAAPTQAVIQHFDNGGAGWFIENIPLNSDMITFKMDGTVVVNDALDPGLGILGQDAGSFTLTKQQWFWYGTDEKLGNNLTIGADVGFVAGTGYEGAEWDVGRLGGDYEVGPTLADSRVWSDHGVTSTGGLGGWNFYFHGEWPFGGGGYIGLYADDLAGRHYGWASIYMGPTWHGMKVNAFAFQTNPTVPILAGDEGGAIPGDFDGNLDVDDADIDLLCDFIRLGLPYDLLYDVSGPGEDGVPDGFVDVNDLNYHVHALVETTAGPGTEYGDFNLDGMIDTTDLARLATNFGPDDWMWNDGNANRHLDTDIDNTDLTILATFYGFGVPDVIPEPMTLSILALGASGLLRIRRNR